MRACTEDDRSAPWGPFALTLYAMSLGCCCGPGSADGFGDGPYSLQLAFTAPRDADVLTEADDNDDDLNTGIQYDVRVATTLPPPVTITVRSSQDREATADVDDDGVARFASFPLYFWPELVSTPVTLTATVDDESADDADGGLSDTIDITIVHEPHVPPTTDGG